jgi:hypothetical protein
MDGRIHFWRRPNTIFSLRAAARFLQASHGFIPKAEVARPMTLPRPISFFVTRAGKGMRSLDGLFPAACMPCSWSGFLLTGDLILKDTDLISANNATTLAANAHEYGVRRSTTSIKRKSSYLRYGIHLVPTCICTLVAMP